MAALYKLLPVCSVVLIPRLTDLWLDKEYRDSAKRVTRLERASVGAAGSNVAATALDQAAAAKAAWFDQQRN